MGLGQVLRYSQLLEDQGYRVAPALAVELAPEESWVRLCERLGVMVVWPDTLTRLVEPNPALDVSPSEQTSCGSAAAR